MGFVVWCELGLKGKYEQNAFYVSLILAYISPGVSFHLRWHLSPIQMKCTSNANGSTYILSGFLLKMG